MYVNRPEFNSRYRIEATENDPHDQNDGRKKKGVHYKGRKWKESEEEGIAQDQIPRAPVAVAEGEKDSPFWEKLLSKKATAFFDRLTNLEDKVAQLCFLSTEALYDAQLQNELSQVIQRWQIGGLLFEHGSYQRQTYLIDHYQQFSKIPLLVGNDYLHNLTFYFQDHDSKSDLLLPQHYSDLGKAMMGQNKPMGVHFLFDHDFDKKCLQLSLNAEERKAIRRGVRQAHGVVARDLPPKLSMQVIDHTNLKFGADVAKTGAARTGHQFIGMRTLFLHQCPKNLSGEALKARILEMFNEGYEAFLLSGNPGEAIGILCELVRSNQISLESLDRRILKTLMIKSFYF